MFLIKFILYVTFGTIVFFLVWISSELVQNGTITFNQKSGWIKQQKINVTATQTESVSDGKQSQSIKSVTSTTIAVNP